jgi:RHS repeat-associated protein
VPQTTTLQNKFNRSTAWLSASALASPFGSSLTSRVWSDVSRVYRYGFNGIEKENDQDYFTEFRLYNPDLGRWISVDKLYKSFINSYNAFSNSPIVKIDPNGLSDYYTQSGEYLGSDGTDGTDIKIVTDDKTILLIKKNRAIVLEDNKDTPGDDAYYQYEVALIEGTYFVLPLPSLSDRNVIKTTMEGQQYNQMNEVGGAGYWADNGETYYAASNDGPTVSQESLETLFRSTFSYDEDDGGLLTDMPLNVSPTDAADNDGLNNWKSSVSNPQISFTWHSHPFIPIIGYKNSATGTYDIKVGQVLTDSKSFSYLILGGDMNKAGTSSYAESVPSATDLSNSKLVPMANSYIISNGANTITHYKNGNIGATVPKDFFYNITAKKKPEKK